MQHQTKVENIFAQKQATAFYQYTQAKKPKGFLP